MTKRFFYFLLLLCFANSMYESAAAQDMPNLKFNHLNVSNGLSSDLVKTFYQDKRGIIWIATEDGGFNRFDGDGFKIFKHISGDSTSLPSNDVRFITEDQQNNLWITTLKGLYVFNPTTEIGKTITLPNNASNLYNVFCDSKNNIWINNTAYIFKINAKNNVTSSFNYQDGVNHFYGVDFEILTKFYEDEKGNIFIGSYLINQQNLKIENTRFNNQTFQNHILLDSAKNYWAVNWNEGLKKWNETTKRFEAKYAPKENVLDVIRWKFKGKEYFVLSVYPLGIVLYDINTSKYYVYKHSSDEKSVLSAEDRWMLKDRDNRIWIASPLGIDILDPELQNFNEKLLYKLTPEKISETFGLAASCLETNNGFYISGSYRNGLFHFSKNWKLLEHFKSTPTNSTSIHSKQINNSYEDKNGNLWMTTDSGLVQKTNNSYQVFLMNAQQKSEYKFDNRFLCLTPKNDNEILFTSAKNTVCCFNLSSKRFSTFEGLDLKGTCKKMYIDENNILWIGTYNGLYEYNFTSKKLTAHTFESEIKSEQKATNTVRDFIIDNEKNIFITTENGLIKYNSSTKAYKIFDAKQGLFEPNLFKIQKEDENIFWISCPKVLIKFSSKTERFQYFDYLKGLPVTGNLQNAFFKKLQNNNLLLGFEGGVVEFNPKEINSNNKNAPVILLDAYLDDIRYSIYETTGNTKSIVVKPNQQKIQLHYGFLKYSTSSTNKIYFYLEGISKAWQENTDGDITFYNLPSGKYILKVKSFLGTINDRESEDSIEITVKAKWYELWWIRLLGILIITALIYGWVKFRANQIQKTAQIKSEYENKMLHLEMQTLRSQMNPHFLFNTLNSINSYIIQNKTSIASEYLTTFSKLMRNILELSKQEKVTIDKEIYALKMYIELEALRLENKFDYSITIDKNVEQDNTYLPSLIIQPFVENAIWHGLHNKADAGHIGIHVAEQNQQLIITIEDDGIGRKAAADLKKQTVTHKSFGIDITINRIKILDPQNTVIIIDLYSNTNNAMGTKVVITINNIQHD